jgi:hypothetical protein
MEAENKENAGTTTKEGLKMKFDPNVSHPLKRGWDLWYDSGEKKGNEWGVALVKVATINTVFFFLHCKTVRETIHSRSKIFGEYSIIYPHLLI